jgi:hypothetical protein
MSVLPASNGANEGPKKAKVFPIGVQLVFLDAAIQAWSGNRAAQPSARKGFIS